MIRGSHGRCIVLTVLMLGLAIHAALPTRALGADVQKRLEAIEETLVIMEKFASDYNAKEVELAIHLSAAQRQEQKVLAEWETTYLALAALLTKVDPRGTEQMLAKVRKLTSQHQNALEAWQAEVKQARRFQDEICTKAAMLKSDPRPPSGRVSGWNDRAARLLESSTSGLRARRVALSTAWDALNNAATILGDKIGRLKAFISRKDEFEANYKRLTKLASGLEAAQKDMAKVHELLRELRAMQRANPVPLRYRRQELYTLRQRAGGSSGLVDRIDKALAKLESVALPEKLPEAGSLSPKVDTFLQEWKRIKSAKEQYSPELASSVVAAASPVLAAAQAALKQASSSQAGFGGLARGRKCAAGLRQAKAGPSGSVDPTRSLIEDLQTRLEAAERREHLFTDRNLKNLQLFDQAKRMAKEANHALTAWQKVWREQSRQPNRSPDRVMFDSIKAKLEGLLKELSGRNDQLQQSAGLLARLAEQAGRQKQAICVNAGKLKTSPIPQEQVIKAWHQQASREVQDLRSGKDTAHKKARKLATLLAGDIKKVTDAKGDLVRAKDSRIIELRVNAILIVELDRALDLQKRAEIASKRAHTESEEIKKLKEAALKELGEIQRIASELAPSLSDAGVKAELESIRTRAAALAQRYNQARISVEIVWTTEDLTLLRWTLRTFPGVIDILERGIGEAVRMIKHADGALKQARKLRQAAAKDSAAISSILLEADRCVAILAKGPAPGGGGAGGGSGDNENQARQALDGCDLGKAETLINALPQGQAKTELAGRLSRAQEARAKLALARTYFDDCKNGEALTALAEAGRLAKCATVVQAIADLKAKAEAGQRAEGPLRLLVARQAKDKFRSCELQDAMNLLLKAQGMATCRKQQEGIKKRMARVAAAQKTEAELLTLLRQASAQYRNCDLTEALKTLEKARPLAKCKAYMERVDRMGQKAHAKQQHELTTLQLMGAAKALMREGKYAEARPLLVRAKTHTRCSKYETAISEGIAKVDAMTRGGSGGSGGGGQQPPDPPTDPPRRDSCEARVRAIQDQAKEVRRLHVAYLSLYQAGRPLSETGPAACAAARAYSRWLALKRGAIMQARCEQAKGLLRPMGKVDVSIVIAQCRKSKEQQGGGQQSSCDGMVRKIQAQAEEVRRVYGVFRGLHQSGGPLSQTGPAACEVITANDRLRSMIRKAADDGCRLPRSRPPVGAGSWPLITLQCQDWKGRQGGGQQSSCDGRARKIQAQAKEVSRLISEFMNLLRAQRPISETGPAACAVLDADKISREMQSKNAAAGCPRSGVRDNTNLKVWPSIMMYCGEWKKRQGVDQASCDRRVRAIRAQADKVRRLKSRYTSLKQSGQPESVTGPVACRTYEAAQRLNGMKQKARDAGCKLQAQPGGWLPIETQGREWKRKYGRCSGGAAQ